MLTSYLLFSSKQDPVASIQDIPFGVLSEAQDSLAAKQATETITTENGQRKRKRDAAGEAKLQELRARLAEIQQKRAKTERHGSASSGKKSAVPDPDCDDELDSDEEDEQDGDGSSSGDDDDDGGDDDDSDSDNDGGDRKAKSKRSSKHAPTVMSSTKQVPRLRTTVAVPKRNSRDPRFISYSGPDGSGPTPKSVIEKRYSFLDEYRRSEIDKMKQSLADDRRRAKMTAKQRRKDKGVSLTEEERDEMTATVRRMEDQERSKKETDRLAEVEREHMQKERELVRAGKKAAPYYLKKGEFLLSLVLFLLSLRFAIPILTYFFLLPGEVKRLAIEKKFTEMKGKDRDRAIERRRKKISSKEKKAMPALRRSAQ